MGCRAVRLCIPDTTLLPLTEELCLLFPVSIPGKEVPLLLDEIHMGRIDFGSRFHPKLDNDKDAYLAWQVAYRAALESKHPSDG